MLVSISEGLAREGLLGAILFSAAVDILALVVEGRTVAFEKFACRFSNVCCESWRRAKIGSGLASSSTELHRRQRPDCSPLHSHCKWKRNATTSLKSQEIRPVTLSYTPSYVYAPSAILLRNIFAHDDDSRRTETQCYTSNLTLMTHLDFDSPGALRRFILQWVEQISTCPGRSRLVSLFFLLQYLNVFL